MKDAIDKEIKSYRWELFVKVPNCPFWILQSALFAYVNMLNTMYGTGSFSGLWIYKNNDIFMYHLDDELENAGRKMLARDINEPGFIKNILDEVRSLSKKLINGSSDLQKLNVNKISNGKLAAIFSNLYGMHDQLWFRGQAINILEMGRSLVGDRLRQILLDHQVPQSTIAQVFNAVTLPEEYSYLQKEEQDLLGLVEGNEFENKLEGHWRKYAWLGYNWQGPAFDVGYFRERVRVMKKENNFNKYRKEQSTYQQEVKRNKHAAIKRYKLPREAVRMAKIIERIAFLKAYRVDASWMFYWSVEPFFKKIAREHYWSLEQVQFLKPAEITNALAGVHVDAGLANQRKNSFAIYFHDGKIEECRGEAAGRILDWVTAKTAVVGKDIKVLRGDAGSPGRASGLVKIIDRPQDIPKMHTGDVLVSHTTNPRLVPAMKLASAIVTDVGGVTSHAAIISRELKIPCVIGTKIATKVLKDGDRVEVDADKGVVKKI